VQSRHASFRIHPVRLTFVLLLATLHLLPGAFACATPSKLTVLFTHDLHSSVLPCNERAENGSMQETGGYERLAGAIDNERQRSENTVILLDAGNFSEGSLFHALYAEEALELRLMAAMGYDAITFGNQDVNVSPWDTTQMLRTARMKSPGSSLPRIVISNLRFHDSDDPEVKKLIKPLLNEYPLHYSTVIEKNGLRIGIIGLIGKNAAKDAMYSWPLTFTIPVKTALRFAKILREQEKADLVICLSHSGTDPVKRYSEDEDLALNVPDIDIIISGHSQTVLHKPIRIGKTLIVSAGCYGKWLGVLDLDIEKTKGISVAGYRLQKIDANVPGNKQVAGTIADFKNLIDKHYLSHFGYSFDQVIARQPFQGHASEDCSAIPVKSGLGNLVTDAYRYAITQTEGGQRHIDTAVDMLGCIRSSLCKGDIRISDVCRTVSLRPEGYDYFGNTLLVAYLTGHDLKNLLEIETSIAPKKKEALLSVSGLRFRYNPNRLIFDRVTSIEIEGVDHQFHEIDSKRLYSVAISSYLADLIGLIEKQTLGILTITLRDKNGNPVDNKKQIMVIRNGEPLREWIALAEYLSSFPASEGKPTIPEKYATSEGRIIAEPSWNAADLVTGGSWVTRTTVLLIMVIMTIMIVRFQRHIRRSRNAASTIL
jgi:2',3'-cyclic-nucleotide 2'-phosphodiesterase (5'-nucleotidase family)